MLTIYKATISEINDICKISNKLWKTSDVKSLFLEYKDLLNNDKCIIFLAKSNSKIVGFAQCQLRNDYVEGTSTSPVGYLEGIFVEELYRNKGIAKKLLNECKTWAKQKQCKEFASDCELDNKASIEFHKQCGFNIANKIVCFTQKL